MSKFEPCHRASRSSRLYCRSGTGVFLSSFSKRTGNWRQAMRGWTEYSLRRRSLDELLPWDVVDIGLTTEFMKREYERAMAEKITKPCPATDPCVRCGVCDPQLVPENALVQLEWMKPATALTAFASGD